MTKHRHLWLLAGKPELAKHGGPRGGRYQGWTVAYRCATCREVRRGKVDAAVMELKSGGGA